MMRLPEYSRGRRQAQRAALWLSRRFGAELDDVAKVSMRRPGFFGRPFLDLAQHALRGGRSAWSVGERELFAAVVSRANACQFCVGTHGEIAARALGSSSSADWRDGRFGPRATAGAHFVEALTRDPDSLTTTDLDVLRAAQVDDAAIAELVYIAFVFSLVNRVADALDFSYRSEGDRVRGARILRRNGYRLPGLLLR
jgi:uncharacterized peroxidase-related enzyme